MPGWRDGAPNEIWPRYFAEYKPDPQSVQTLAMRLHSAEQHEHVISAIQSALINGQSQPWMYEVLALSMEIVGRPKEEVERVVSSMTDFGAVDYGNMMYTAAYLARFDRRAASLRLYRQASRLAPERPETYILGLRHARYLRSADDVQWAACGILNFAWTRDYAELHREAENAALEAEQLLRRNDDNDLADALRLSVQEAQQRDLIVRLTWSGGGDLDLIVEEPVGTVCSFENRDSPGGGVLVHDGYGPEQDNCYEEYICAHGARGDYRLRVRHAWGRIVGGRATLTVVQHAGSAEESRESHTIVLDGADAVIPVTLDQGRRTGLKPVATFHLRARMDDQRIASQGQRLNGDDHRLRQAAAAEFEESRNRRVVRAGAIGYQPVVTIIPDGVQYSALPVISADRRYVRISSFPAFTELIDVATFSFISGAGGGGGVGGGGIGGGVGGGP